MPHRNRRMARRTSSWPRTARSSTSPTRPERVRYGRRHQGAPRDPTGPVRTPYLDRDAKRLFSQPHEAASACSTRTRRPSCKWQIPGGVPSVRRARRRARLGMGTATPAGAHRRQATSRTCGSTRTARSCGCPGVRPACTAVHRRRHSESTHPGLAVAARAVRLGRRPAATRSATRITADRTEVSARPPHQLRPCAGLPTHFR